ncbi:MAG: 50S ribosomal protein L25 [Gammaproteobacteria bacterium TMED112]|nr:MAG: 50S ribosomal protein L25 [Gammaproteobacteria bacterium TMED112]|tara:strand:- start:1638 stop:2345 length:708 start_codon:yes stop_codon:yes gene_type:complete
MENLKLKAEKREKIGGLSSKTAIYKENKIPGIIYGGKGEPLPILVNNNELLKIINKEGIFNTIVEVELDKGTENVVFKEVQKHPSKNIFTHIDLQRVVKGTKVNVVVPVLLKNQDKCFGVKIEGGVINHVLKEISVLASPESIPESIEVDMEDIKAKEKVRLGSLAANSEYDFPSSLKNQDPVLVSVLTAKGGSLDFEDEEVDDVEEGAETESTEATDEKSSDKNSSDNSEEKAE